MTSNCSTISDTLTAMRAIDEHLIEMQDDIRYREDNDRVSHVSTYVFGLLALTTAVERVTQAADPSFFTEDEVQYIMSVVQSHADFLKENINE